MANQTDWSTTAINTTSWNKVSVSSTSYNGRYVINTGALFNDEDYIMADTVVTLNDVKLQSVLAPGTTWT